MQEMVKNHGEVEEPPGRVSLQRGISTYPKTGMQSRMFLTQVSARGSEKTTLGRLELVLPDV
jgi:hypothetical protein